MRFVDVMAAGCALGLGACGASPPPELEGASAQLPDVRRIVTSEDSAGRSYVLKVGPSGNVVTLNGSRINRLWETEGMPVPIPVTRDLGAAAGNAYRPGFVGSSLYVADLPPGSDLADIPVHKQESMDYIVLLEGEVDLVLGNGERVAMKRGDVLIQAGNDHSWVNTGTSTARLLCVTMTGDRRPMAED